LDDLLNLLLTLTAVIGPLGLAWWLLRERKPPAPNLSARRPKR